MVEQSKLANVRAFDVFCSIGGLTYGLQNAGIEVNAGLDIDPTCKYAYEKNCNASFLEADIREIKFSDISKYFEDADYRVLVGCAPCQPFSSHTSKVESNHHLWDLINEFLRVILEGMPDVVSMENVPRLVHKPIYKKFKRALIDAGYRVLDQVVSCCEFWCTAEATAVSDACVSTRCHSIAPT